MHIKAAMLMILSFVTTGSLQAQPVTDSLLANILYQNNDSLFQVVIAQPGKYRLQIIYTRIDRDEKNKPHVKNYYFHHDPNLYYYPASTVKMPLAFLSLEKLNTLRQKGLDKYTTVQFDSSQPWQTSLYRDSSAADGRPTIAHLIKRAFLISENDPYNRMYQFLGQNYLNKQLHRKGYNNTRIVRQFLGLTDMQNRYTNAVRFMDSSGSLMYKQPPQFNRDSFDFSKKILVGSAYVDGHDSLVKAPFDFSRQNAVPLESLQQMLQSVLFPESVPKRQRFRLSPEDRRFLLRYLSQYPSETPDPKYDTATFYDSYVKFFFGDSTHRMPEDMRVFNKVGWSYGFLTDVSYVADFRNNLEFMLSATVYVNADEILNDDKYEYEKVGLPFMYQLGQTIYGYERSRTRKQVPDFSGIELSYEKRTQSDNRPALRQVDN